MKELDIVKFVQKQMLFDVILKTLFAKHEIDLMKNHRRFVLGKQSDTSEEEDSKGKTFNTEMMQSQYCRKALYGTQEADSNFEPFEKQISQITQNKGK